MRKIGLLLAASCLASACGFGAANAAVTLVSANTSSMFGTGFSNIATFNSLPVGSTTPFMDTGLMFAGMGYVVNGSVPGVYAAPTGDTTNYLATNGSSGSQTITLNGGKTANRFGLYWGSIDGYNSINFLLGGTTVGSFTGSSTGLNPSDSAFVSFAGKYDTVVLSTGTPNFEVDNVSVGGVPEASTWAMMLIGFGALGFAAYGKSRRRDAGMVVAA